MYNLFRYIVERLTMLKMITFAAKVSFYSILILIIGNLISIDGKSLSDQVKIGMAQAERNVLIKIAADWVEDVKVEKEREIKDFLKKAAEDE